MNTKSQASRAPWIIGMIFLLLSALIGALGFRLYLNEKLEIRNKIQSDLSAIADLKANLITVWRKERIADAMVIYRNQSVAREVIDYLEKPEDRLLSSRLLSWMNAIVEHNGYASVLLFDKAQKLRLGTRDEGQSGSLDWECFQEAVKSGKVVISDLYRRVDREKIRMDLCIPIGITRTSETAGVIVLRIDPYRILYPTIQSWPTPSPSAETLIVRNEKDRVVFLNELRHRKNSALSFSLPLNTPQLPAARVVQGKFGVTEGVDYRGVPVLAALRPIPETSWYMVSKVDSAEVYSPIRERAWVIIIVATLLIVVAGIGVGLWWKHEAGLSYRRELESERERQEERAQLLERERDARKEAEAANRMKDEFLATVSHELRTPLIPILGWAYELRNEELDETTRAEAYEAIERNARLQSNLVEDLLDVSRIITGKLHLDIGQLDLPAIMDTAIEAIRPAAEAKNIRVCFKAGVIMGVVHGDGNRLQQIAWNLLSNAVKFTPRGGEVSVSLKEISGRAEITVSDSGKGISPEFLPFVFDRFRQGEKSAQRQGGLGLGLSIVRHLVELHGGNVTASSPGVGKGSEFTVALPVVNSPEAAAF
jgi:signal transduction histidine kinase